MSAGYNCRKNYGSYYTYGLAGNIYQGGFMATSEELPDLIASAQTASEAIETAIDVSSAQPPPFPAADRV